MEARCPPETPFFALAERGEQLWRWPNQMPQLIHQPEQLIGKLPGAWNLITNEGSPTWS